MAKFTERLDQLLQEGKIDQSDYDDLADLSVAKEAIKEFNQVRSERDELAAFKAQVETAPKRREALKRVGIDYDAQPKYGRKTLDAIPADKLDDLNFIAGFVREEGFEASLTPEQQSTETSGAEQMTDFLTSVGEGSPRVGVEAARAEMLAEMDKVQPGDTDALNAVLAKYGAGKEG